VRIRFAFLSAGLSSSAGITVGSIGVRGGANPARGAPGRCCASPGSLIRLTQRDMTTDSQRGRRRRWRPGFRSWYFVKDLLAMIGGAVVLYHASQFIEAYLHGATTY
jgi:hypothetical protein